jgi:hypothetical protein
VFEVKLPPVGSAFVVWEPGDGTRVRACNFAVDEIAGGRVRGHAAGGAVSLTLERDGHEHTVRGDVGPAIAEIPLDTGWELLRDAPNALVVSEWWARPERAGSEPHDYAARTLQETGDWLAMVQGAWSFQLPTEPDDEYPIPVWYRIGFDVEQPPAELHLLVDGFAGIDWTLYVNGSACEATPQPSRFDAQIGSLDISPHIATGRNVIALRLVVGGATDGLLDLVKLVGDFRVTESGAIAATTRDATPSSWSEQGCPNYSGTAVYRCAATLPETLAATRVFLAADAGDDALEVVVNGRSAGVRLWPPYTVEVTDQVVPGENTIDLRVANTAINMLSGVPRPSGLRAAPRLILRHAVEVDVGAAG